MVSNCEFVTFPLVSWVRCGTLLYRFLIFAPLLTLKQIITIRRDGKSPDLKVNDKQLQTAFLVYIFDDIILNVNDDDDYVAHRLSPIKFIQGR